MILTGMHKGFTHPETVQLSQRIDDLLNMQQKKIYNLPLNQFNVSCITFDFVRFDKKIKLFLFSLSLSIKNRLYCNGNLFIHTSFTV